MQSANARELASFDMDQEQPEAAETNPHRLETPSDIHHQNQVPQSLEPDMFTQDEPLPDHPDQLAAYPHPEKVTPHNMRNPLVNSMRQKLVTEHAAYTPEEKPQGLFGKLKSACQRKKSNPA